MIMRLILLPLLFGLTVGTVSQGLCRADQLAFPAPQIYGSEYGERALKVVPDKSFPWTFSTGTWIEVDSTGRLIPKDSFRMVGCPRSVLIPQTSEYLVTLDMMGRVGYEHALLIYRHNKVVRDMKVEDILSDTEIFEHVLHTTSSRWWRDGASFTFDTPNKWTPLTKQSAMVTSLPDQATLSILFPWGKKVIIKLATGKVVWPPTKPGKGKLPWSGLRTKIK